MNKSSFSLYSSVALSKNYLMNNTWKNIAIEYYNKQEILSLFWHCSWIYKINSDTVKQ